LIYTTEKSLGEFGEKVDPADKRNIEDAIAKAKKAMESNEIGALKSAQDELTRTSHKLAEAMYSKAAKGAGPAGAGAEAGAQQGPRQKPPEDVVDADFEDVGKK
jgi:molecular chaperone DnaK